MASCPSLTTDWPDRLTYPHPQPPIVLPKLEYMELYETPAALFLLGTGGTRVGARICPLCSSIWEKGVDRQERPGPPPPPPSPSQPPTQHTYDTPANPPRAAHGPARARHAPHPALRRRLRGKSTYPCTIHSTYCLVSVIATGRGGMDLQDKASASTTHPSRGGCIHIHIQRPPCP